MKTLIIRVVSVCALMAGFAFAEADRVKLDLPYEAKAMDTVLPPGEYEIRELETSSDIPMLLIQSGRVNVIVPVMRVGLHQPCEKTELILDRMDDGYVVAHLLIQGRPYRYDISSPRDHKLPD